MPFARALLVTLEFAPFKGGVARYYENFAREWGKDIVVYTATSMTNDKWKMTNTQADARGTEQDYRVIRKSFYWKWIWPRWGKLFLDLFFYFRANHPSVVFVGNVLPVGVVVWFLQYFFQYDFVVFTHGLDVREHALTNSWKVWLVQQIFSRSGGVVTNSEYTKRLVCDRFSIPEHRVQVLFSTGSVQSPKSKVQSGKEEISKPRKILEGKYQVGLKNDDIVILSVGRLVQRKGWDEILTAAGEITDSRVKSVFIGDGPERTSIEEKISASKLHGRVFLMPPTVSDEEKELWFEASDIFLLLPKDLGGDVEGFGIVFLEASAHGLPVIGRDSGGVREAIRHEETGYLWDGKETRELLRFINVLVNDRQKREITGERGRTFVERLNRETRAQILDLKNALAGQDAKVSIVIPVGYDLDRIWPTLHSLEKQTYKNLEVIVVGDGILIPHEKFSIFNFSAKGGSTSGGQFSIKIISIQKSGGAAARNAGARLATGEYFLFVDDDTRLREDCIEKMVRRLGLRKQKSNEIDFVYSGFRFGWKTFPAVPFDRRTAYHYPYFDTTSMLRRDAFPGFSAGGGPAFGWDESLKRFQDWDLFLTILDRGGKGEGVSETLYFKNARLFKNLFRWKGISFWFPKFVWKLPFVKNIYTRLPPVKAYSAAREVILKKHPFVLY